MADAHLPLPHSLYSEAYFEGPMARWHRLSQPTFGAFLRERVGEGRRKPARALDLGCGDGAYGPLLAEIAEAVDGCDGAPPALERARARGVYRHLTAVDLAAERWQVSEPRESYDLIFSTEVIEHLPDEDRFSAQVASLLAPGGLLVLTTTTYHLYLFYYLCFAHPVEGARVRDFFAGALGDHRRGDRFVRTLWELTGGHEHGFTARRLLGSLRRAGLTIEAWRFAQVQPVFPLDGLDQPRFTRPGRRWPRGLLGAAGRTINALCRKTGWYGANILVAARKGEGEGEGSRGRPEA